MVLTNEKTVKEKKPKPKYNMWQNSLYMMKAAWTSGEGGVIFLCVVTALLSVASNLVNLYISPAILSAVERHVSISELILTILGFTLAIMILSALSAYVGENVLYGRISVRTEIVTRLNRKAATTWASKSCSKSRANVQAATERRPKRYGKR